MPMNIKTLIICPILFTGTVPGISNEFPIDNTYQNGINSEEIPRHWKYVIIAR
jgi:hypothetical protein